MKYQPERDLELAALETKSVRPTVLAKWILNKRNEERSPVSITNFFTRNPDVKKRIDDALAEMSPTVAQAVDNSLFENGNFREVPSVKEWILYMNTKRGHKGKDLHPRYIEQRIYHLKAVCKKYSKHPDRLTYHDAQEIIVAEKTEGKDTNKISGSLKAFLMSKGVAGWEKIGVGKPRGFGQYNDLKVEKPVAEAMLGYVETVDFETYVADEIMYHNGIRITAVLTARIEDFKEAGAWHTLKVLEKFRETPTFKLVPQVAQLIKKLIGERKEGFIFNVKNEQAAEELGKKMAQINNKAIEMFCPELLKKYAHIHSNHFYRHECIQLLLELTHHNTAVVAAIIQCSEQSLKESYGAATDKDIEAWENEFLSQL